MARVPVIARVEARCGGRGEERPVAVWLGGERRPVTEVVEERLVGPAEAGGPVLQVIRVVLEGGERLLLERRVPEGDWRTYREV